MSIKIYARVNQLTKRVDKVINATSEYISGLPDYDLWIETTKDGSIRKNFAGIGYTYDVDKDAFIPPKSFDSWTLNETTCRCESPSSRPDGLYHWNETDQSWDAASSD